MKIQDINRQEDLSGGKDIHEPKTTISQTKLNPDQLQGGALPAGSFGRQPGLEEFETLKTSSQVDMGSIKSRDLGNMLSGELVRIGEAAAKAQDPDVDFGDLPSKILTEMGKDIVQSE